MCAYIILGKYIYYISASSYFSAAIQVPSIFSYNKHSYTSSTSSIYLYVRTYLSVIFLEFQKTKNTFGSKMKHLKRFTRVGILHKYSRLEIIIPRFFGILFSCGWMPRKFNCIINFMKS